MTHQLDEILKNITDSIDEYENLELADIVKQGDILRKLTANLFYLEGFRVDYHFDWLDAYNSVKGTNAHKERHADDKIRELYMTRRLITSGHKVADSIRSTISVNRKES